MYLKLIGHDYKYAVEQIMLVLFPGEKPVYAEENEESCQAVSSLSLGRVWATARTELTYGGNTATGIFRVQLDKLTDELTRNRLLQRILKQSFYKAAVGCTGIQPPWGALTGIRPAKLASKAMKEGKTEAQTRRMFQNEFFVSPARTELALDAAKASLAAEKKLQPQDISLYLGIPFCPTRCAYCSFVSADVQRVLKLVEPYLAALEREIDAVADYIKQAGSTVRTIYIGGGTPSTLSALQLERLITRLRNKLDLSNLAEFTVEAGRPETITDDKMRVLHDLGVDRVSVNPQTMRDEVLAAMGRAHTAADIPKAYEIVRRNNIPIVNMDLIAGLPKDTVDGFHYTLDTVLSLDPENITVHTLALKKGARLMMEREGLPSGEETSTMLDYAWDTLRRSGQEPYYLYRQKYMSGALENIGWCKPGTEGLYNICIMEELHSIVALGAGGSTKLTNPATGQIVRITNPKYPQQYIERIDQICQDKAPLVAFQQSLVNPIK